MKKHLFVVAHCDDEVLGAGAYMYELARQGDETYVLVLNTCDMTRYAGNTDGLMNDLYQSHRILGVKKTFRGYYTDSNFNIANHREMVEKIESVIREVQPDVIYTNHPGDINSDHFWTAQSCMEAFRLWQRGRESINPTKELYFMEVQSSTDWSLNPASAFKPNTYVRVEDHAMKAKIEALIVYENVIRPTPHPRSVDAIMSRAIVRGAEAGVTYAEAFECAFKVVGV